MFQDQEGFDFITKNFLIKKAVVAKQEGPMLRYEGKKVYRRLSQAHPWIKDEIVAWGDHISSLSLSISKDVCPLCHLPLSSCAKVSGTFNPYPVPVKICDGCELPFFTECSSMFINSGASEVIHITFTPKYFISLVYSDAIDLMRSWAGSYNIDMAFINEAMPMWDNFMMLISDIKKANIRKEEKNDEHNVSEREEEEEGTTKETMETTAAV